MWIFNLPFHKPKTKLTVNLVQEIYQLLPESPENSKLTMMLLKNFDKRAKFSFYELKLDELPQYLEEVKEFLSLAGPVFFQKDYTSDLAVDSLLKTDLSIFFKFVLLTSLISDVTSPAFSDLVSLLQTLSTTAAFQQLLTVDSQVYPLYSLVNVILDFSSNLHLAVSKSYLSEIPQQSRDIQISMLKTLVQRKYTPLAALVFCEHIINKSAGNVAEALAYLDTHCLQFARDMRNTPGFMQGYELEVKGLMLKSKVVMGSKVEMPKEKKAKEFEVAMKKMSECQGKASNFQIVEQELPILVYNYKLQNEGLKSAREYLDGLEASGNGALKSDWIKSQKAWLTYSFIDDITTDRAEQIKIVEGVLILLKESLALNPANVETQIRIGTIIFSFEQELGIQAKQASIQWMTALKTNQLNADLFYCLALYYFFVENDYAKAIKCLDKTMLLKPDHEEAGIFHYQVLVEQGHLVLAFQMLENIQKINPLLAYPYYFLGVRAQNSGDYANARVYFENAARYHSFSMQNPVKTKPSYPLYRNVIEQRSQAKTSFSREMGIFSKNGIALWVHLTECYLQLEKYPTAEKCLKQVLIQINSLLSQKFDNAQEDMEMTSTRVQGGIVDQIIEAMKSFTDAGFLNEDVKKFAVNISRYFRGHPETSASLQLDIIEILILAAKVESKIRNYYQSLVFSGYNLSILQSSHEHLASNTELISSLQWEILQGLLETLIHLIHEHLGGKSDRKQLEKTKCINALSKISNILIQSSDITNERIMRLLAQAFKVIGVDRGDKDAVNKAISILDRLRKESKNQGSQYQRGIELDIARLYHLLELKFSDPSYREAKIVIIRNLIKQNPACGEYWIYHGIFQQDLEVKKRSYYKAIQINPKDQFALNNLLCLYLRCQDYRHAFHLLNHLRDLDSLNALVIALMTLLHARVALEQSGLSSQQRRQYLDQAISIGEMFMEIEQEKLDSADESARKITSAQVDADIRVDIHQYLSQQMNYLVTLMKVENKDEEVCSVDVKEMVAGGASESRFLRSVMVKQMMSVEGMKAQEVLNVIQDNCEERDGLKQVVRLIQDMTEKDRIEQKAVNYQKEFKTAPTNVNALKLIAIQQSSIDHHVILYHQLLDGVSPTQFKSLLDCLDQSIASRLLHQCLLLLSLRQPNNLTMLTPFAELLDENAYPGLSKSLPTLEYEKVFHLYLLSAYPGNQTAFRKELKKTLTRKIERVNTFIQEIMTSSEKRENNLYAQIMKEPHKLSGYNDCLWKVIKDGEMLKAQSLVRVIRYKIESGIIDSTDAHGERERFVDYTVILSAIVEKDASKLAQCKVMSHHLLHLLKAFITLQGAGAKFDAPSSIDEIAQNLIIPWLELSSDHDELMEDQMALLYNLLNKFLLQRGQLTIFNELGDKLLARLSEHTSLSPFFGDEFKLYLMLNMGSNFSTLGKKAIANKLSQQIDAFLKDGSMQQRKWCIRLYRAALALSLNQHTEAENKLQGVEGESYEKEILLAQTQYAMQFYKKYYLSCITLVASLKRKLSEKRARVETEHFKFLLAYSYFMKAKAELTFMEARLQGIILKEDFSQQESVMFNVEHFKTKASKSLNKASHFFQGWSTIAAFVDDFASKL